MLWAALLSDPSPSCIEGLVVWGLQFTPRVAIARSEAGFAPAVLMELESSVRLFGGRRRLAARMRSESAELGATALSWATTGLGALALARGGVRHGFGAPLAQCLDALPLSSLDAVHQEAATLARLGCRTLGQVRVLPRAGLGRRFGAGLLEALDQAYGLRPETPVWEQLPERFHGRLELMARVETAPALMHGARRLLLQLCGWLAARCCGVTVFTLRWCHDGMRSRHVEDGGELTIRTAQPTRQIGHLGRLLTEQLARVELQAPVGELHLLADEIQPFEEAPASLLPDERPDDEPLPLVLERMAARLGNARVLRPVLCEDHRPEWQVQWQPAQEALPRAGASWQGLPQPGFLLPQPVKLGINAAGQPLYHGALKLLSGPHRIEGGWWHRVQEADGSQHTVTAVRDYWVAQSEQAGVLWLYQTRLAHEGTAWYLHGFFA